MRFPAFIAVLGLALMSPPAMPNAQETAEAEDAADLSGLWLWSGKYVFKFTQTGDNFTGGIYRYFDKATAKKYGQDGDGLGETFNGKIAGRSAQMTVKLTYPVDPKVNKCGPRPHTETARDIRLSADGATIDGRWRYKTINDDSCKVSAEGWTHFRFKRWPALVHTEVVHPETLEPIDEITVGESARIRLRLFENPGTDTVETAYIRAANTPSRPIRITGNTKTIVSEPTVLVGESYAFGDGSVTDMVTVKVRGDTKTLRILPAPGIPPWVLALCALGFGAVLFGLKKLVGRQPPAPEPPVLVPHVTVTPVRDIGEQTIPAEKPARLGVPVRIRAIWDAGQQTLTSESGAFSEGIHHA